MNLDCKISMLSEKQLRRICSSYNIYIDKKETKEDIVSKIMGNKELLPLGFLDNKNFIKNKK